MSDVGVTMRREQTIRVEKDTWQEIFNENRESSNRDFMQGWIRALKWVLNE